LWRGALTGGFPFPNASERLCSQRALRKTISIISSKANPSYEKNIMPFTIEAFGQSTFNLSGFAGVGTV
jgi:hypothetical protein